MGGCGLGVVRISRSKLAALVAALVLKLCDADPQATSTMLWAVAMFEDQYVAVALPPVQLAALAAELSEPKLRAAYPHEISQARGPLPSSQSTARQDWRPSWRRWKQKRQK